MTSVRFLLVAAMTMGLFGTVQAESDQEPPAWQPPADSKFDWIRLTSGEWLKGSMDLFRNREIEFDSDNLDDLVIDWEDVQEFYLRRPKIFRLESGENVQGLGEMRDDVLTVQTDEGERQIPRSELVSAIPGDGSELEYWSGYLSGSWTMRDGNTDQLDLSGTGGFRRESAATRWKNDYRGVYGKLNGEKTEENHRADTAFDVFLTSRFYLTLPFVGYLKDEFQNLEHRVTPGAGIGYEFVRNGWMEWESEVGMAYQYTSFESGQASANDAAVVVSTTVNFDLPKGVELDNLYKLQVVVTNTGQTSHHFESILSVDIWGPIDLDATFLLDRVEKPERDGDGDLPESTDTRVMVGISVDF